MMSSPPFTPLLTTPRIHLHLHIKTNTAQTRQLLQCLNDSVNIANHPHLETASLEECREGEKRVGLPLSVRGERNEEGPCNYLIHLKPNADDGDAGKEAADTVEGELVGMVNLLQPCVDTPVQIGWLTLQAHTGKGYATEAAGECLRYWHEEFGVEEIVAVINRGNEASKSIARKIGMSVGGVAEGKEQEVWLLPGMRSLPQDEVVRLMS